MDKQTYTVAGKTIDFEVHSGIVKGEEVGGYPEDVHAETVANIDSRASSFQRIFLNCTDGRERDIKNPGFKIAVRPGHRMTAVLTMKPGKQRGRYAYYYVHDTQRQYFIQSAINHCSPFTGVPTLLVGLAIPALVSLIAFVAGASAMTWLILIFALPICVIAAFVMAQIVGSRMNKTFRALPIFEEIRQSGSDPKDQKFAGIESA